MEKEKLCYVIMPYGGDDESKKKRFKSIFNAIIKPAVESKGYRCVREDHESRQGNITKNIIQSLGDADIVIADLSENNWTVAYELGMRHVLSKNGTILLIDDATRIMFDIQSNKLIDYSVNWYESIDETQQAISDAIDYIEKNPALTDSPVHDVFTHFPKHLTDVAKNNSSMDKEAIAALTKENARLKEILEDSGISTEVKKEKYDVSLELKDALNKSQYLGMNAIVKLRETSDAGDQEKFVTFLGQVLTKGFLTESEMSKVYFMCNNLNNHFITQAFLEEAVRRFPENEELTGRLARIYAQNSETREKAILTVNKIIGVKKVNNQYVIERKKVTYNMLGAFFDVYIRVNKHEEMLEIGEKLLEVYTKHSDLIRRNIITALKGLDRIEEAELEAKKLVADSPKEVLNQYSLYSVYRAYDNHEAAYKQAEVCIALDPADSDYYIILAGVIADSSMARMSTGENGIVKIAMEQLESVIVPFVFRAYSVNNRCMQECYDFLQRNGYKKSCEIFKQCLSQKMSDIPVMDNYDYTALAYCLEKVHS